MRFRVLHIPLLILFVIEVVKKLSSAKRDVVMEKLDSSPWIRRRSVGQLEQTPGAKSRRDQEESELRKNNAKQHAIQELIAPSVSSCKDLIM
jgi:hypothetical protein